LFLKSQIVSDRVRRLAAEGLALSRDVRLWAAGQGLLFLGPQEKPEIRDVQQWRPLRFSKKEV
jgi:hypothetical protein